MFDWKILLIILAIALVIFGTKRLRTIGSDLGAGIKEFKDGVRGEVEAKPLVSNGEQDTRDVRVPSKMKTTMNSPEG